MIALMRVAIMGILAFCNFRNSDTDSVMAICLGDDI
jgi:hypothetical protein